MPKLSSRLVPPLRHCRVFTTNVDPLWQCQRTSDSGDARRGWPRRGGRSALFHVRVGPHRRRAAGSARASAVVRCSPCSAPPRSGVARRAATAPRDGVRRRGRPRRRPHPAPLVTDDGPAGLVELAELHRRTQEGPAAPDPGRFTARARRPGRLREVIEDNAAYVATIDSDLRAHRPVGTDLMCLTSWMSARLVRDGEVQTARPVAHADGNAAT